MKSYKLIYVILILTCLSCTSVEDRIKEYIDQDKNNTQITRIITNYFSYYII